MKYKNILIFGAGGRIGLPFAAYLANRMYNVIGVELQQEYVDKLNTGVYVPFKEEGLDTFLQTHTGRKLNFRTYDYVMSNPDIINDADSIVILLGTPLLTEMNPYSLTLDHTALEKLFEALNEFDLTGKDIWLRSTVEIGFTRAMRNVLKTGNLYFWPERVIEGKAIHEFDSLPDIVGTETGGVFVDPPGSIAYGNQSVTYEEAEFIKLATNSARYALFSISNELWNIADDYNLDFNKLHGIMTRGYKRLEYLAYPGPNVAGPCLSKDPKVFANDGAQLFSILSSTNNKMLTKLIKHIKKTPSKIMILGTAFKEGSDDVRGSAALELWHALSNLDHEVCTYDEYTQTDEENQEALAEVEDIDYFIVMTPHPSNDKIFKYILRKAKDDSYMINLWGAKMPFGNNPSSFIKIEDYRKERASRNGF